MPTRPAILSRLLAAALLLAGLPPFAYAQSAENVLVVINESSPASVQVGEYYAAARKLPPEQVARIPMPETETVTRAEFGSTIEAPIGNWLRRRFLQDRVLYIVLTKGVPIRISGTGGLGGTVSSVDSELTLLYRRMLDVPWPIPGRVDNPIFLGDGPIAKAPKFTRHTSDLYLVTRLDAFTVEETLKLIDRGLTPRQDGTIVLDQRATMIDRGGDRFLQEAAKRLEAAGQGGRVMLETSSAVAKTAGPVIGYYSWGSNDRSNRLRRFGLEFVPGAIGGMFVSTDGRTFAEPPADWIPVESPTKGGLFGTGSQSLSGDLIRDGITGVSAHVDEPFLDATIRPQILFPAYLAGFNLAESFYMAMPYLSWQTIVIGDPLVAPFATVAVEQTALHKGIDPETESPALYAERRLALTAKGPYKPEAMKLWLKTEAYGLRNDDAGRERILNELIAIEPRLIIASLQLASYAEGRKDWDRAIELYRGILAVEPNEPITLNNLAYALAVHKGQPAEALPLAERALARANSPTIADTVAWIHHLMGNNEAALPIVARAAAATPGSAEIQFHAAVILAATGDLEKARAALDAAIKADPTWADRDDVKALRTKVGGGTPARR